MKERKKLTLEMAIFTFIIFIIFGVIILNEKSAHLYIPRIDKKLANYINTEYKKELDNFVLEDTTYKNTKYQKKITNKDNKNLYFIITYNKKKIVDTYKKDYQEGNTLITNLKNKLEKELKDKYQKKFKITNLKNLNQLNSKTKKTIINKNTIRNLGIYTLETSINSNFDEQNIATEIINLKEDLNKNDIIPRSYNFTIINKNKKLTINNITNSIIDNPTLLNNIIHDIINKEESNILKENNITYKYEK